jgi:hypothetical protein
MIVSQLFPLAAPQSKSACWHLVPTVPLNRGSGFACGVENMHAEMVGWATIAAHEASASNKARLGRMGRLLQNSVVIPCKKPALPIAATMAISAV